MWVDGGWDDGNLVVVLLLAVGEACSLIILHQWPYLVHHIHIYLFVTPECGCVHVFGGSSCGRFPFYSFRNLE
jgi:hypothetical protein